MSVSVLEKLTAIVPEQGLDELLAALARMRCVEILPTDTESLGLKKHPVPQENAALAARLDAVLPRLADYSHRRRRPLAPPPAYDRDAFLALEGTAELVRVLGEAERLLAAREELCAAKEKVLAEMRTYTPFLEWERPLSLGGTAATVIELGALPAGTAPVAVLGAMENRAAVAQIVCNDKTGLYLALIVSREEHAETLRALSAIGFAAIAFPRTDGTAKVLFDRADRERARLFAEIARLDRRLTVLAERTEELRCYSDILHTAARTDACKADLGATESCAVLTALVPRTRKAELCALLDAAPAAYSFAESCADTAAPVAISTPAPVVPFAGLFGTDLPPVCRKFDPVWLFAVALCLCFGLSFADAGYGLVLALGALLLCRLLYLPRVLARGIALLGYCGAGAALCGVLTGRWFGGFSATVAEWLKVKSLSPLAPDVQKALLFAHAGSHPLLPLALAAFLTFAYFVALLSVRAVSLLREKRTAEVLLDTLPYLLCFAGALLLLLASVLPWFIGLAVLLLGLLAVFLLGVCRTGEIPAGVRCALGGLARYGAMLCRFGGLLVFGVAAAPVGMIGYFLPAVWALPAVGLVGMIAAGVLGLVLSSLLARLGAWAHMRGVAYADPCGRFFDTVPALLAPLLPVERYGRDATPIQKKREVVRDDRT